MCTITRRVFYSINLYFIFVYTNKYNFVLLVMLYVVCGCVLCDDFMTTPGNSIQSVVSGLLWYYYCIFFEKIMYYTLYAPRTLLHNPGYYIIII